jgi:xanthine dehydrogenase accessory factor
MPLTGCAAMFDLGALQGAVEAHGRVARVVVAGHEGSAPREAGAAMLVWATGQSGTIGGGALEFAATARARELLAVGGNWTDRVALGPTLGQCCGGAVTVWSEVFDAEALPKPVAGVIARGPGEMPLAVARVLAAARGQGVLPKAGLVAGWMVEPVVQPLRQIWVWGAGHVGRALVAVLAPLPGLSVTWVDTGVDRFPEMLPEAVTMLPAADPATLAAHAPVEAEHLILTFSHALDLELCHKLLLRGFASCGLIGSATKWARFQSRLQALGHAPHTIARIRCPIGEPAFGKHPQQIAVGVAADILRQLQTVTRKEMRA